MYVGKARTVFTDTKVIKSNELLAECRRLVSDSPEVLAAVVCADRFFECHNCACAVRVPDGADDLERLRCPMSWATKQLRCNVRMTVKMWRRCPCLPGELAPQRTANLRRLFQTESAKFRGSKQESMTLISKIRRTAKAGEHV